MKELKCPLCGKELVLQKLLTEVEDKYFCRAACPRCYWLTAIGRTSEKRSWQDAEEFISRFPHIMRVWPGDKVFYSSSPHPATVVSKNINNSRLKIKDDVFDEEFVLNANEIDRWPWEIKQTEKVTRSCDNCKYNSRASYKSPCLECMNCKEEEDYKYWAPCQKGGEQ